MGHAIGPRWGGGKVGRCQQSDLPASGIVAASCLCTCNTWNGFFFLCNTPLMHIYSYLLVHLPVHYMEKLHNLNVKKFI